MPEGKDKTLVFGGTGEELAAPSKNVMRGDMRMMAAQTLMESSDPKERAFAVNTLRGLGVEWDESHPDSSLAQVAALVERDHLAHEAKIIKQREERLAAETSAAEARAAELRHKIDPTPVHQNDPGNNVRQFNVAELELAIAQKQAMDKIKAQPKPVPRWKRFLGLS